MSRFRMRIADDRHEFPSGWIESPCDARSAKRETELNRGPSIVTVQAIRCGGSNLELAETVRAARIEKMITAFPSAYPA